MYAQRMSESGGSCNRRFGFDKIRGSFGKRWKNARVSQLRQRGGEPVPDWVPQRRPGWRRTFGMTFAIGEQHDFLSSDSP